MIKKNKFVTIIITLFCLFLIPIKTNAVSNVFSAKLKIKDNKIEETGYLYVDLDVNANYVLNGLQGEVFYDKNKIELVEIDEDDKFDAFNNIDYSTPSSFISFTSNKGKSGSFSICSLVFKVTDDFVLGDIINITIKNIIGTNDTIGIGNHLNIKTSGIMNVKNIFIDNDVVVNNKYVTNKETVNISVDIENGNVISGDGNVNLKIGSNIIYIYIEDDNGNRDKITIDITRNDNDVRNVSGDNDSNTKIKVSKVPDTGDYIIKYFILLFISLLCVSVCVIYKNKKRQINKKS